MGCRKRSALTEPACYHITHRCQERRFLLKFALDRGNYIRRLRQMASAYPVSVLDDMVTCNHVHLLLWARRGGDVAAAMHFLQGNTTRDYNRRKGREGSFWRGRYPPAPIESGRHLSRFLFYIDMNMVRAGAVDQPADWDACGYRELAEEGKCGRPIIDRDRRLDCLEFDGHWEALADWHRRTLAEPVSSGWRVREPVWSTAAAIGTRPSLDRLTGRLRGAKLRDDACAPRSDGPTRGAGRGGDRLCPARVRTHAPAVMGGLPVTADRAGTGRRLGSGEMNCQSARNSHENREAQL